MNATLALATLAEHDLGYKVGVFIGKAIVEMAFILAGLSPFILLAGIAIGLYFLIRQNRKTRKAEEETEETGEE